MASPTHRGIGHFLAVTLEAYRNGAYRWRDGFLESSPLREAAASRRYALPQEVDWFEADVVNIASRLQTHRGQAFAMAYSYVDERPDERYVPILRQRLQSGDDDDVASALFALGQLRAQAAVPEIVVRLGHSSAKVRNFAGVALSRMDSLDEPGVVDRLIATLDDEDDLVRTSAIEALATARSPKAVDPLLALLDRSRPGIQEAIVSALATLRSPRALPALRALRVKVAAMDQTLPDRGGRRSSDPPPARLLALIDRTIRAIGG